MHMVGCVGAWNFGTKLFLRGENVKPQENPIFSKMGKIVISVKIRNFSRSRMTKRTFLLKSSHEIKQPHRILLDSDVVRISRFSRRGVSDDIWQGEEMPHGTSKGVTLGIKEMVHIEPHGWHDPMAHNEPLECMMS